VGDSSAHSSDSAASIGGVPNDPSKEAPLENYMPPPTNPCSRLMVSQHFLLDSHEGAATVSFIQSPPESQVPSNHKFSPTSIPVCWLSFHLAQVPAAASALENHQPPAHASFESALSRKVDESAHSGKVDYGPVKYHWLKYSFEKGLEKKFPNPPHLPWQETIILLMRILVPVPGLLDPMTFLVHILLHKLILQLVLLVYD